MESPKAQFKKAGWGHGFRHWQERQKRLAEVRKVANAEAKRLPVQSRQGRPAGEGQFCEHPLFVSLLASCAPP